MSVNVGERSFKNLAPAGFQLGTELPLFITEHNSANRGATKHRIGCIRPQKCTLK